MVNHRQVISKKIWNPAPNQALNTCVGGGADIFPWVLDMLKLAEANRVKKLFNLQMMNRSGK